MCSGYQYSPTGQLIKTSATKPLELGVVSERPISESQYKITIKYPDKIYELTTSGTFMSYARDVKGYVYGVNDDSLWRYFGTLAQSVPLATVALEDGREVSFTAQLSGVAWQNGPAQQFTLKPAAAPVSKTIEAQPAPSLQAAAPDTRLFVLTACHAATRSVSDPSPAGS